MRAGIAMGSNMGDRRSQLQLARSKVFELPGVSEPYLCSGLYETEPVGCESGAGEFLNAVLEVEFHGDAGTLLEQLKGIESLLGRRPRDPPNFSRSVDLDLLYVDDQVTAQGRLQLPHPRAARRRFVLTPLADIRSDLVIPGQAKSVGALLEGLCDDAAVVRVAVEW